MAMRNMKQAKQWAEHYGVTCQLIAGAGIGNCKAIIIDGTTYKTSIWTGVQFEQFFRGIACTNADDEILGDTLKELISTVDIFEGIDFINSNLLGVFNQIVDNSQTWQEYIQGLQESGIYTDYELRYTLKETKEYLKQGFIFDLDNHIVSRYELEQSVNHFRKIHKMPLLSQEVINEMIAEYVALYESKKLVLC